MRTHHAGVNRPRRKAFRLHAAPEQLEGRMLLSTFTVTNTLDDTHKGSLRWAIGQVNSDKQAGTDTILFNIPGTGPFTISPLQPLPTLTHPVVINGYSQPGAHPNTLAQGDNAVTLVRLDGINLQSQYAADGIAISAGGSTVEGLDITQFNNGIHLLGSGQDAVAGNFIGIDLSGAPASNFSYGVLVEGAPSNSIGGSTAAARNIISDNGYGGILVSNSPNDLVQGNYIGTDASGTQPQGNGGNGGGVESSSPVRRSPPSGGRRPSPGT